MAVGYSTYVVTLKWCFCPILLGETAAVAVGVLVIVAVMGAAITVLVVFLVLRQRRR